MNNDELRATLESKNEYAESKEFFSNIQEELISFSGNSANYCVSIVDMVNSTKITSHLPNNKACRYYGLFLNSMASLAVKCGAKIVKNLGDSLLYYFPYSDTEEISDMTKIVDCGLEMLAARDKINTIMTYEQLPPVSYRISADYGWVLLAKQKNTSNIDIFGPAVNMCARINRCTIPNSMIIGSDLYHLIKTSQYSFLQVKSCSVGHKVDYPVYMIKE